MKILVTGAAGYIASHLAEKLVDLGHEVVGIDCFTPYYDRVLKDLNAKSVRDKGVNIYELDLASDDLTEAVEGVEVVYHLAAQPGISSKVPLEDYVRNNIVATENLVRALKDSATFKFFVNIATSSIYGLDASFTEDTVPRPASYYGVTKLAAEQLVLAYNREEGMPACSLRLYSVYGPRERPEKLYPRVYRSMYTDYEFPLYDGSQDHLRSYTFVLDIVDGLTAVLDNMDKCNGEIINLGLDETITTGKALEIIEEEVGIKPKYKIVGKRYGDQYRTSAIIDKAKKLLGYDPKVSPEEGLKITAEWYKETIIPLIESGEYKPD